MQFIQARPFADRSRDALTFRRFVWGHNWLAETLRFTRKECGRFLTSSVGDPDTLAGLTEVQLDARNDPELMSASGQTRTLLAVTVRCALPP